MPRLHISRWERLERFLLRLIQRPGGDQGHGRAVNLLLRCLRDVSVVYLMVVQTRLFLYNKGVFRRYPLGCQVVSVGNLTVGGTGKTPVVEIFARELQQSGRKVAILSRGYRRKEPPFIERLARRFGFRERHNRPLIVSDGNHLLLNSEMSGDEPYMLAANLKNVVVLVDRDRVKSGRYAIKHFGCDTLILDDGFQYQSLKHRLEIVLVDFTNPFGNGHVLPRGILREPIRNIKRADFVLITKSNGDTMPLRKQILEWNPRVEIIDCIHRPRLLRNVYTRETAPLEMLKGMRVLVLSGIAAPLGFERTLTDLGVILLQCIRYADHHRYTQQEIIEIVNQADRLKADAILTTEKDAVRIPRLDHCAVPLYFLRVDIEIIKGAEGFRQCVEHICFRRPARVEADTPDGAGT